MLRPRRLPSLNGIRAFEAAARSGAFTTAAAELNVTPAAVSRLVRLLEQRLGIVLFDRHANRLTPTAAGEAFRAGLTPLLDRLARLTAEVVDAGCHHVLTVGVGPSFAIRWLIPRLADFTRTQPGIDVRIATGGAAAPFADGWSCGIRLGDGTWPGLVSEFLVSADLVPVCAPAVAAKLSDPSDLVPGMLLRVAHAADDWLRWASTAGLSELRAAGPIFDFYGQAQQAAADGVGVALGVRPYVDDDLAAGRLVALFGITAPKIGGWHLVYRPTRTADPALSAFRDWIRTAARRA
ncbi:LysR family transcriptional regulator [Roseomonas terrae]|uniref:LysR family transcriptional regulator n=1 Tax=Neoroseomonas terrae TaxID=424799 RepID=A0ABS5ECL8_9PROT|nr:LysR substrate-binding domain-containing protein [Neoroseomonas terrae]MBR0648758.1 LysR family transcriptional regulator [Neoroseomonas terrae]